MLLRSNASFLSSGSLVDSWVYMWMTAGGQKAYVDDTWTAEGGYDGGVLISILTMAVGGRELRNTGIVLGQKHGLRYTCVDNLLNADAFLPDLEALSDSPGRESRQHSV
mmetsp:Transcript_41984/g.50892  ORF Transcript_41984/g.50892 Transcript_41984/m.50892 type:complete len:109 (+) Transcript_41984:2031-2357(+)